MTIVILIGIALALFALVFVTRRRFGVLGLGLTAGVILQQLLGATVADFLESQGLPIEPLSYATAAQIFLILLPPLILLAGGPKYHDSRGALVGSLAFSLLATLFILGPLTRDLPTLDEGVKVVLDFIAEWRNVLVAGGVIAAVIDMFLAHGPKLPHRSSGKGHH